MTNDTRLWCLHHIGADEVHPAPDFETAWKWATWANERFADDADICRFTVAVWPWSPEGHADGLAASIADWTLPTPAQPVDETERLRRANSEAIELIDELNKRATSRKFWGISQTMHNKLCTIRATLARAALQHKGEVSRG